LFFFVHPASPMLSLLCAILLADHLHLAGGQPERESVSAWQKRSIYQIITDRYSRSDGDESACDNLRTYCGGTWRGITRNLDYIKDLGFDAIWISPVAHNMDLPFLPDQEFWGAGYHGYWVDDWTRVNQHFGTEDDLKELVEESHKRDIWVMLDVVANHGLRLPAYPGQQEEHPVNPYILSTPFNKPEYYHQYKLENGWLVQGSAWDHCYVLSNKSSAHPDKPVASCFVGNWACEQKLGISQYQVEVCWSGNLADLNQDHPFVRQFLLQWIHEQKTKFGFDGLRVDTQPYVSNNFWAEFRVAADNVFTIGETTTANVSYLQSRLGYPYGLDSALSYPLFYAIVDAFGCGPDYFWEGENYPGENSPIVGPSLSMLHLAYVMSKYADIMPQQANLAHFIENHDQPRFLWAQPSIALLRNALTLIFFVQGIPIVYYGMEKAFTGKVNASMCNTGTNDAGYPQSGSDPCSRQPFWMQDEGNIDDRGMIDFVRVLNKVRREQVVGRGLMLTPQQLVYVEDHLIVFLRGHLVVVLTNKPYATSFCLKMSRLPFAAATQFKNLLDPQGKLISVTGEGVKQLCLAVLEPMVLAEIAESRVAAEEQTLLM